MEKIIDPISVELLKNELTPDKKLHDTHKGGNELYIITAHDSPNVMKEIGRLREEAFRFEGGSSGLSMDIDEYDTMEVPYKQLIVWDPDANAIIGGYRYILGKEVTFDENGLPKLATAHMFEFSKEFLDNYLPHTIELGRSFVSLGYQSSKAGPKAIFSLDNLWDGIISVAMQHPDVHFLFGKFTMYPSYNRAGRDLILHFLAKHFPDHDNLVRPFDPVLTESTPELMDIILDKEDFKTDYRSLKQAIHKLGTAIPPLVNSYMNTSRTMRSFGTAINHEFSEVEETAILVCLEEINEDVIDRHRSNYYRHLAKRVKARFPQIDEELFLGVASSKIPEKRSNLFKKFKSLLRGK